MTKIMISSSADINGKSHTGHSITGYEAGEQLLPCTPVVLRRDGNDGNRWKVYRAVASDGGIDGISSPRVAPQGSAVTILGVGYRFHASDEGELTPGHYGLTANSREIDSEATVKLFRAVSKNDLEVVAYGEPSNTDIQPIG